MAPVNTLNPETDAVGGGVAMLLVDVLDSLYEPPIDLVQEEETITSVADFESTEFSESTESTESTESSESLSFSDEEQRLLMEAFEEEGFIPVILSISSEDLLQRLGEPFLNRLIAEYLIDYYNEEPSNVPDEVEYLILH
jgi:hypothetical protein